ncbi:Probable disease resistance protein [Striga hermonthica]|uniref:Probable disease resistance protein n=1 Tax=Striga hermonthica TaxID=68872 RepID=A0A9N7N9X9_STRHE|nr:Probable disease resistance protein [Striga hermonthica]
MALIETFLLNKLVDAIEEAKHFPSYSHFAREFSRIERDLKYLVEKKLPQQTQAVSLNIKEKLYSANNLVEKKLPQQTQADSLTIKEKLYSANNLVLVLKNHQKWSILEASRAVRGIQDILKEIRRDIDEIPQANSPQNDPEVYRWSTRLLGHTVKIYGFEDQAMERLLVRPETESGLKAFGFFGMAGVGKTTLCQAIFNNSEVEKHFLPRIWVCLSRQPKLDKTCSSYKEMVIKRILTGLGFEREVLDRLSSQEEGSVRRLLFVLRQQLRGRKYLIVLDDIWNPNEEDQAFFSSLNREEEDNKNKLSYGLPRGNGGAVIVTSRSAKLVEKTVGGKNMHEIFPLENKDNCWEILKNEVKEDRTLPGEELKDLVVQKCDGLPLAAKIMGNIVHEKLPQKKEKSPEPLLDRYEQPIILNRQIV